MNILEEWAQNVSEAAQKLLFIWKSAGREQALLDLGVSVQVSPPTESQIQSLEDALEALSTGGISFESPVEAAESIVLLSDLSEAINGLVSTLTNLNADEGEQLLWQVVSCLVLDRLWWESRPLVMALAGIGAIDAASSTSERFQSLSYETLSLYGPSFLELSPTTIRRVLEGNLEGLFGAIANGNLSKLDDTATVFALALGALGTQVPIPISMERSLATQIETTAGGREFHPTGQAVVFTPGPSFNSYAKLGTLDPGKSTEGACVLLSATGTSSIELSDSSTLEPRGQGKVILSSDGVDFVDGENMVGFSFTFEESNTNERILGLGAAFKIALGAVRVTASAIVDVTSGQFDVVTSLSFKNASLTIDTAEGDGFLSDIVGGQLEFSASELGIGVGTQRGVYVVGGSGLSMESSLVVRLGPIQVRRITVSFAGEGGALLDVGADLVASLGPLSVTIQETGFALVGAQSGGTFALADISSISFSPPKGAGIDISSGGISGGGYLFFNDDTEEYGGAVELSFQTFSLAAVGLITTKMPDGSDGFSMMVIISAEFQGVQLGFGFTLTGVGGLLGINRQADVQALRSNMKNGGLSSIMFPEDVVENAQRIVSDVGKSFPVADGNHVFGPILRIGWGTPTLFELTLGVVISIPAPVKVVLLGRFELGMPTLEYEGDVPPPVWIKVDFLGSIDPAGGLLSLDGVLYDSRLATFSLEGQFAMQQSFGDDPLFLVSVGGFHPDFEPPPQVPELSRLSISLGDSDNPRLRADLYTAITSNTVQMGARTEVYAKVANTDFEVMGTSGFDALITISPFSVDIYYFIRAHVQKGSKKLLSINVDLNLTGPKPWRAKGRAKFKVLMLKVKVRFSLTFGKSAPPPLPETDVLTKLTDALAKRSNWAVKLPAKNTVPPVTFRELPNDGTSGGAGADQATADQLVHPDSNIAVRQKVVPLGLDIDRYSGAIPVANGQRVRRFDLDNVTLNATPYVPSPSAGEDELVENREKFAPGAYLELTDEEKLSRPSFESFPAGGTLAESQGYSLHANSASDVSTQYEQSIVDTSTGFAVSFVSDLSGTIASADAEYFSNFTDDSGVASSAYQADDMGIQVDDPSFAVVSRGDATQLSGTSDDTNFHEADRELETSGQNRDDYHVVLTHEEQAA